VRNSRTTLIDPHAGAPLAIAVTRDAAAASTGIRERLVEYVALSKPRIATMVLVSVAVGFTLAMQQAFDVVLLMSALLGIGMSAAASSILNQWYERETDARMPRTADRPLPAGRVSESEALWLGISLAVVSTAWLAVSVNVTTALLTLATCLMYVGVYTPLKPVTAACTAIGAVPGAMPLVLGWTAAGGELSSGALALFAILYVWQFPHFLAIAWIYQDQYRGAGLRMLPADGKRPAMVGLIAVGHAAVLIPVTLWARSLGLAGDAYALVAIILGCWYLLASVRFASDPCRHTAKRLLWTSLAHLPMLLAALTIDHVRLLR
jgi:heme o synthase